ncbi:MAG: hypothetical protein ACQEV6_04945 [Pseudomonadota bacterium]
MTKPVPKLFGTVTLTAVLGLSPMTPLMAENVAIPVGSQAERSRSELPQTGMSQASVRDTWGTPREIRGPVGEPPISQWHYDGFVVYFEGDRVLHAVLNPER